jgi:NADPH:quinone reductase-like Zn-dependent oxidoreductase
VSNRRVSASFWSDAPDSALVLRFSGVQGDRMQAIVQDVYGSDPEDVLRVEEIDVPVPGSGEALVRVHAASVDRGTWHIMAGLPYAIRLAGFGVRRPKFTNPGRSVAGVIESVGPGVADFQPGDEVYGVCASSFAQFAVVGVDKLARKAVNTTFEQAATVPISGLTALQAVRDHGQIVAGEHVLIIGASGGVGSFAVQIAKSSGAEVTGVCGTAKLDMVRALGADHVLDYSTGDITDGTKSYDVILDIAGNRALRWLRRSLTDHGRLFIVGGETDGRLLGGADRQVRAMLLSPFVRHKLGTFVCSENAADLVVLAGLIESGHLTPSVERSYPLSEVAVAMRHLVDGGVRGKLAIGVS